MMIRCRNNEFHKTHIRYFSWSPTEGKRGHVPWYCSDTECVQDRHRRTYRKSCAYNSEQYKANKPKKLKGGKPCNEPLCTNLTRNFFGKCDECRSRILQGFDENYLTGGAARRNGSTMAFMK